MKIKAQITIDINQYENIKPEIEIDTENLVEAQNLVKKLWIAFHGLMHNKVERNKEETQDLVNNIYNGFVGTNKKLDHKTYHNE